MENPAPTSRMRETLALVARSRVPMLVLQVPSEVITAASPSAAELLDPDGQALVGRSLANLIEGDPSGAMPLLAGGRLTGYETIRALKRTGQRWRLWISAVPDTGPTRTAVAVLRKEDVKVGALVPLRHEDLSSPVIGSTDAQLVVDRVSPEVYESLGHFVEDVVGTCFLSLIVQEDIPEVLSALARASKHDEGVTLRVGVIGAGQVSVRCHLVLLPLAPAPSCAFALLREDSHSPADSRAVADLITRLRSGIRGGMTQLGGASAQLRPDVDVRQLSGRELEIVRLLMAGDRVPAIAKQLFLSEGTIRNHLSSVFGKMGVRTQQELIELLRERRRPV